MKNPPVIADSERLQLKIWQAKDWPVGLALWGNPKVMHFIEPALTEEEVKTSLVYAAEHQSKFGCQHWAVEEKLTGQIIGCCGFNHYEDNKLEMVFHFIPRVWGKGYATEAGKMALNYATRLSFDSIVASTHPKNKASQAVLLKLNFKSLAPVWCEDTQEFEPFFQWVPN